MEVFSIDSLSDVESICIYLLVYSRRNLCAYTPISTNLKISNGVIAIDKRGANKCSQFQGTSSTLRNISILGQTTKSHYLLDCESSSPE